MSAPRRVSIGFEGGQVLSVRVAEGPLRELGAALAAGGGGWHELSGEEQTVSVDLARIVYLSSDSDEPHVGFG